MASVRMTNELRDTIRHRVNNANRKLIETLRLQEADYDRINDHIRETLLDPELDRTNAVTTALGDSIRDILSTVLDDAEAIELRVHQVQRDATVNVGRTGYRNPIKQVLIKVAHEVNHEDSEAAPEVPPSIRYLKKNVSLDRLKIMSSDGERRVLEENWGGKFHGSIDIELGDDLLPDIAEKIKKELECEKQQKDFFREIARALDECNTVGQLLKVWPEAKVLLPESVLRKMKERAPSAGPRTKAEITPVGEGARRLTGLAVALNALDE